MTTAQKLVNILIREELDASNDVVRRNMMQELRMPLMAAMQTPLDNIPAMREWARSGCKVSDGKGGERRASHKEWMREANRCRSAYIAGPYEEALRVARQWGVDV